jgi:hypothetical protein
VNGVLKPLSVIKPVGSCLVRPSASVLFARYWVPWSEWMQQRSPDAGNTMLSKEFPAGLLVKVEAEAAKPVRRLILIGRGLEACLRAQGLRPDAR